jgi:spermidine/putrescine transport system permease protein
MKQGSPAAKGGKLLSIFVGAAYFFLYIPIIVLVAFSFNSVDFSYGWQGFSLKWYHELFQTSEIWEALQNSLIVAFSAVAISVTLSVLLVFYGARTYLEKFFTLFYGSLLVPEVVLAVGLLSVFGLFGIPLGLTSLIVAHSLIGLGYVLPIIYSRYVTLDYRLTEASLDLGASQTQTFFRIILPLLVPALVASALLVFIISLDDFILAFFCAGASVETLPVLIFSVIRTGSAPVINALSTIMLVVSSLLVLIFCSLRTKTRIF